MSLEENKAIICSLIEVFNKHNVALMDDFIAPDFVDLDDPSLRVLIISKNSRLTSSKLFQITLRLLRT